MGNSAPALTAGPVLPRSSASGAAPADDRGPTGGADNSWLFARCRSPLCAHAMLNGLFLETKGP